MHELSLIQGVLETAEKLLAPYQAKRVNTLTVSAGVLANIMPEALDYAFLALTQGTLFQGARLILEKRPLTALCQDCGGDYESATLPPVCPICGSHRAEIVNGGEVLLTHIDFD